MKSGSDPEKISADSNNIFFEEDGYLVLVRFMEWEKPQERLFYWLGMAVKTNEKGLTAHQTIEFCQGKEIHQVRVTQEKETDEFLRYLGRSIVIRKSKTSSKYLLQAIEKNRSTYFLEKPLGSNIYPNYSYFYVDETLKSVVQYEKSATDAERFSDILKFKDYKTKKTTLSDLASSQGGKVQGELKSVIGQCRFFRISRIVHGNPTAEENLSFHFTDLRSDGVYIVDAHHSIYIWIGRDAIFNDTDIRIALDTSLVTFKKESNLEIHGKAE
jgi:hypothetical protein